MTVVTKQEWLGCPESLAHKTRLLARHGHIGSSRQHMAAIDGQRKVCDAMATQDGHSRPHNVPRH